MKVPRASITVKRYFDPYWEDVRYIAYVDLGETCYWGKTSTLDLEHWHEQSFRDLALEALEQELLKHGHSIE